MDDTDAKSSANYHEKAKELTEIIQKYISNLFKFYKLNYAKFLRGNIDKMKFYSYQKSLKEMLQKIQKSFELRLDVNFKIFETK